MKQLRQVTVIGLGLLGASITQAVSRALPAVKTVGYSHRPATRRKAKKLAVAELVVDDIRQAVSAADIVILATPICTFADIFGRIASSLPDGCIVTDVGSTKTLPHQWARKFLPKRVFYVGSHPIAGSEKRGVEFSRDDLITGADCIVTKTQQTNAKAVGIIKKFWTSLGGCVTVMDPSSHDKIFADVSHVPHVTAAALVNATLSDELKFAGRGFIDTSRISSGPANIWTDIFVTNSKNVCIGIDRVIRELTRLKRAVGSKDGIQVEKLLDNARNKRAELIKYKIRKKEIIP